MPLGRTRQRHNATLFTRLLRFIVLRLSTNEVKIISFQVTEHPSEYAFIGGIVGFAMAWNSRNHRGQRDPGVMNEHTHEYR